MDLFDRLFGGAKPRHKKASNGPGFTSSDALMDEDQFWAIIEAAKEISRGDYERHYEQLEKQLYKFSPDDIILFGNRLRFFLGQANTRELWGAIYIIHGGCDEEGFKVFREWVVGQGKDFYYKTIKDPETLADLEAEFIEETAEFEGLSMIPPIVFKKLTRQELPYPIQEKDDLKGRKWDEGDLKYLFPRIYAKYPYNI